MDTLTKKPTGLLAKRLSMAIAFAFCWASAAFAADFAITSPGFFYSFNGAGVNPTITLTRGKTYTFSVNTDSFHPIAFSSQTGGTPPGVTGDNGSSSGTITFAVPLDAQDCIYFCVIHGFGGTIQMIDPPTPPTVTLLGLNLGSSLVLTTKQATAIGFLFTPEMNTNLVNNQWTSLTVKSNKFVNGTNEVYCGVPLNLTNGVFRIRIDAQ